MQKRTIPLIALSTVILSISTATSMAGYLILSDALSPSCCGAKSSNSPLGFAIGTCSNATYIETAGFLRMVRRPSEPDGGAKGKPSVDSPLPTEYNLSQNFPNPFNPVTTITYSLPEAALVRLEIYNVLGQLVRTLVDETQHAGYKAVQWNGRDDLGGELAGGIYLYRLEAGEYSSSKKLLLLK